MTITVPCPHCGEPITLDVEVTHNIKPPPDEDTGPPAGPPRPHLRGGT